MNGVPTLPYRFKRGKSALIWLLMPAILCAGMVTWLTIQRIWQGVFIFLPMLLVFGLLFVFYSSRSVMVLGDRLQVEDRFSGRCEFLFDDIEGVDLQVKKQSELFSSALEIPLFAHEDYAGAVRL